RQVPTSQHIPTLDYYTNSLPIVSFTYASSECNFSINLNPLCNPNQVSYTLISLPWHVLNFCLLIGTLFMDFPIHPLVNHISLILSISRKEKTVSSLSQRIYGFIGIERSKGFKNNAPELNFVCRKKVVLSIDNYDKVNQVELQNAITEASKNLMPYGDFIREYTSYSHIHTIPGNYVIYWELA
uniref:GH3 C-terminal domain-containing protein n=1 Tax=Cucumis melo TaxID=3656 RepID=A0A9I9DJP2_CUCME